MTNYTLWKKQASPVTCYIHTLRMKCPIAVWTPPAQSHWRSLCHQYLRMLHTHPGVSVSSHTLPRSDCSEECGTRQAKVCLASVPPRWQQELRRHSCSTL